MTNIPAASPHAHCVTRNRAAAGVHSPGFACNISPTAPAHRANDTHAVFRMAGCRSRGVGSFHPSHPAHATPKANTATASHRQCNRGSAVAGGACMNGPVVRVGRSRSV